MTTPIRIVLVDDEAMVRVGLRMVLDGEPDLEVVGEAADGAEAVDVVARDRARTSCSWTCGCRRSTASRAPAGCSPRRPASKVVVLTTFDEDDYVEAGRCAPG